MSSTEYQPYLVAFMSFHDDVQYPKDKVFTNKQLNKITPEQIVAHLIKRAYGKTDPTPNKRPTLQRDSTLAQTKKAISFFASTSHGLGFCQKEG